MKEMPPGYRFFPTEEELISFYLRNKLEGNRNDHLNRVIPVLDVFDHEPWHLPKLSGELCHEDIEQWFFFVPRQEREARGGRPSRMTAAGFWKATGSPSYVYSSDNRVIGVNKTMVFYKGKAPTGRKTKWKMNEYRAIDQETSAPYGFSVPKLRHELSLCRVYVIAGSFRAFDRRPLGTETRRISENQHLAHGHDAMPPSQATETGEKTSSSESSYSGGTNLGNFNGQDPLWEWGTTELALIVNSAQGMA